MKLGLIGGEDIKKYTIADVVWENISSLSGVPFDFEIIPIADFMHLCKFYWQFCEDKDFIGFNIALPWKTQILKLINDADSNVKMSAINVVYKNSSKNYIANTDVVGIEKSLLDITNLAGKEVLIIGAGGAGLPTAQYLSEKYKCNTYLYDIKELDHRLGNIQTLNKYKNIIEKKYDIIINATPVGKYYFDGQPEHFSMPISLEEFDKIHKEDTIVQEMNYFPYKSQLLKYAERQNLRTISGVNMLIYQALESFRLYTGLEFDSKTTKNLFDIVTSIAIKKENELF